jgi:hypothetical protein
MAGGPGGVGAEGSLMSRGKQIFKQADVTKALKGTVNAGLPVQRVEIDRDGKIIVFTGKQPKYSEIEDATALIG